MMGGAPGGMPQVHAGPAPGQPYGAAPQPAHAPGPAPRVNTGMGPAPNLGPAPGMGMGAGGVSAPSPSSYGQRGGVAAQAPSAYGHNPGPAPAPVAAAQPSFNPTAPGLAAHAGALGSSTAPTASAKPTVEGLPVAWPLPTSSMQNPRSSKAVLDANRDAQAASEAVALGDPVAPGDLQRVQSVLGGLLQVNPAAAGNPRMYEDINKRLNELYEKLQTGNMKNASSAKVLEVVQALEVQDIAKANNLHRELSASQDFSANKNWLQGLKRLIPAR